MTYLDTARYDHQFFDPHQQLPQIQQQDWHHSKVCQYLKIYRQEYDMDIPELQTRISKNLS